MRKCNPSGGHARAAESLAQNNAAYSFLLPGKVLHFNALNSSGQKNFERGELLQQGAWLGRIKGEEGSSWH